MIDIRKPLVVDDQGRIEELQPDDTVLDLSPDIITITANEDLADRDIVVAHTVADEVILGDNSDSAKVKFMGISLGSISASSSGSIQTDGLVNGFSGLTPGETYFLDGGGNKGKLTATPPTSGSGLFLLKIGVAKSATELLLKPNRPIKLYSS